MNDLPPRKELPDDVRDRLRASVNSRLDAPKPVRSRGPLAVAAGVAVLAAAAVLVGQAVNGPSDRFRTGSPTVPTDELLDEATMNATLDRCVAALGKTPDMPARDKWHPVIGQRTMTEGVVVAAQVEGQPVACQTTPSSVYMSYPTTRPERGRVPHLLLSSIFDGVIVGVADPAWGRVGVLVSGEDGDEAMVAATKDGFFVLNVPIPDKEPEIRVYDASDSDTPLTDTVPVGGPSTGVGMIDRPNAVAESDKQLLSSCLAATPSLAGNWAPGAAITREDDRFLLARDGTRIAVCVRHAKPVDGREYTMTDLGTHTSQGFAPCPIAGVKPDGTLMAAVVAPEASNVEFDYGPYEIFHGPVTNGTYLAPAPGGKMPAWAVVHNQNDMVYNGAPTC